MVQESKFIDPSNKSEPCYEGKLTVHIPGGLIEIAVSFEVAAMSTNNPLPFAFLKFMA